MLVRMSSPHPACLPVDDLLSQCDVRHERRSGPGGQHRNKVQTAVVLLHRPTGVSAEANERRSQAENKQQAVRRLRLRLAVEIRSPQAGTAQPPSELWQRRTASGRIAVSTTHDDFPALLAEALDAVAAADYDVAVAADRLGVSMSQLARLLRREPPAWTHLNDARRHRGLRPLH
jgi:hypothetical protein